MVGHGLGFRVGHGLGFRVGHKLVFSCRSWGRVLDKT